MGVEIEIAKRHMEMLTEESQLQFKLKHFRKLESILWEEGLLP